MPLDGLDIWDRDKMVTGQEILDTVRSKFSILRVRRGDGETASIWKFADGRGELGVITPMSDPFCDYCDRIRLTSDRKLLSCLFDSEYHALKPILRNSGDDEILAASVRE